MWYVSAEIIYGDKSMMAWRRDADILGYGGGGRGHSENKVAL